MALYRQFCGNSLGSLVSLIALVGLIEGCKGEPAFQTATPSPTGSAPVALLEQRAEAQEPRPGETPRLNPNSREYLVRVTPQAKENAKTASGATLRLMNQLSIAEAPDYDPFEDLGKIKLAWRQIAGPSVKILDANSARARAVMPNVDKPTTLLFHLEASNASGKREVELTVTVRPRGKK